LPQETWWVVTLALAVAWFLPNLGGSWFAAIEDFFIRLSRRRILALVFIFLAAILLRIAWLPALHYPYPLVQDEFSYLVQADIFAHGHLSMPTHPMSAYFETFYLNFHPTYSSMYPPAQASILALGQLLGHPWIGVLLSCAAMFAALLWMLQGWFPPHWALLGVLLALVRFDVFSYWINGYWGGAVAATAGALLLGALPRLRKHWRTRDAVIFGLAVCVLANSRPLEGLIFFVAVCIVLAAWLARRYRAGFPAPLRTFLLLVSLCLFANLAFTLYYDWRVTGDPFTIPHELYYRQYMSVPPFIWQKIHPPLVYANREFHNFYSEWVRSQYDGTLRDALRVEREKARDFWKFFFGTLFSIPFLTLPWMLRDHKVRLLLFFFSLSALGLLAVTWFLPHYAAPVFGVLLALLVQAFRHLRRWTFRGRPVGIGWTRSLVVLSCCMLPVCTAQQFARPQSPVCLNFAYNWDRADVVNQLNSTPGQHLVIVRYTAYHNIHEEWVYNAAEIDRSKIVWARFIPGTDMRPLLDYYSGRQVWLVDVGISADLRPLQPADLSPAPSDSR